MAGGELTACVSAEMCEHISLSGEEGTEEDTGVPG